MFLVFGFYCKANVEKMFEEIIEVKLRKYLLTEIFFSETESLTRLLVEIVLTKGFQL
jgi:hypothetical protein